MDFNKPRLYLLDGSKALRAGVTAVCRRRCFHSAVSGADKIRNVTEYLPEAARHGVKYRMRSAYLKTDTVDAKQELYKLHDELMEINPRRSG